MANELQAFSFDDLKKKIAEDTQSKFGSMIPPEVFEQLIEKAVSEFFEVESATYEVVSSYHSSENIKATLSPFKLMVWQKVKDIVRPALDKWFDTHRADLSEQMDEHLKNPQFGSTLTGAIVPMATHMAQLQAMSAVRAAVGPYQQEVWRQLGQQGIHLPPPPYHGE
ncbi:hypothetical protein D3C87_1291740 [compost metagenome]